MIPRRERGRHGRLAGWGAKKRTLTSEVCNLPCPILFLSICCSVPCQPGSSRRVFRQKPISCPQIGTEGQTIVIEAEEIPDILKAIGVIKKCKAFYQCLEDRDRGKVKHCYENDRRWR